MSDLGPELVLVSSAATSWPAWWRILSEFAYFVTLASVMGGTLTYLTVVRPVLRAKESGIEDADVTVIRRRSATLLASFGLALMVAAYAQLADRVARTDTGTSFGEALVPARMWHFLARPAEVGSWVSSGTLILAQNVLFTVVAALLVGLFVPSVRDRLDSMATMAASLAVTASFVDSLPTNPRAETFDGVLDIVMTQTHIIAGCTWLGGLASLALLSRTRRALGNHAGLFWARIWQRFSVFALTAVGTVIASGSWLAWKHVGGASEFVTTTYGRFLLAKILLVLALVSAGAYNQFLLTPRIARAHAAGDIGKGFALTLRHFPAVVAVETALGICVLLIVPFLIGSARTQAGDGATPTVDGGILALWLLLIASLGATFYAAHQVSLLLTRRAKASGSSSRLRLKTRAAQEHNLLKTASAVTNTSHDDHMG
ncbi:MAG: copper resistance D family protein [Pseudonocardiaceae bacterium]